MVPGQSGLIGAIAGDVIGSVHEHGGEKRLDFPLFAPRSGFTDDTVLRANGSFEDNWEVSAQRSLTVTRELVAAGMPAEWIFAAGFGANHPVAPNDTEENRAMNRRVEISPVPRLIHRIGNASDQAPANPAAAPLEVVDAPPVTAPAADAPAALEATQELPAPV